MRNIFHKTPLVAASAFLMINDLVEWLPPDKNYQKLATDESTIVV